MTWDNSMLNEEPSRIPLTYHSFFKVIAKILFWPLLLSLTLLFIHYFLNETLDFFSFSVMNRNKINFYEPYIYWIGLSLSFYWFIINSLNHSFIHIAQTNFFRTKSALKIVLPFFLTLTKTILCLIFFNQLIQYADISKSALESLAKLSSILIISGIAWVLIKLIDVSSQLLLHFQQAKDNNGILQRKMFTQVLILKRIGVSVIIIIAVGCSLMLFNNVRALGASMLTTAGIAGLGLTFMAQRSLGSIFAGLEIALTQPIKIGDSVIIDNEFGIIEEINFRSVIIKLWDWRRLVVPTQSFLEKSFQNWSRHQDNSLIGSIYMYADFTLSIPKLRIKLNEILAQSNLWDGNVSNLQITDLREQVMQIRILASAKNPDDCSNLQSEIREKIIAYIVKNHPESLPFTRTNNPHKRNNIVNDMD